MRDASLLERACVSIPYGANSLCNTGLQAGAVTINEVSIPYGANSLCNIAISLAAAFWPSFQSPTGLTPFATSGSL